MATLLGGIRLVHLRPFAVLARVRPLLGARSAASAPVMQMLVEEALRSESEHDRYAARHLIHRTLARNPANMRIFPALNIPQSGTRKEEKLMDDKALNGSRMIRRHLIDMPPQQAMKHLIEALQKFKTNAALYESISR